MKQHTVWRKTHCARMDHGGCAIQAAVEDNRIVRIKGDRTGYLNNGYVCAKGQASASRLDHHRRLTHPLVRIGDRGEGKFRKASWQEALSLTAERLCDIKAAHGAKAVAFCQGMPKGLEHFVLIRLAHTFGSPNIVVVQDVCHAPREISGILTCGYYPVPDLHHESRLALVWGSNITGTNEEGLVCRLLHQNTASGTQLIVVDPRKTDLARKARHWLPLKPGTDAALALAFLNVVVTENRYDADFVDKWTVGFRRLSAHLDRYTPEKASEICQVPAETIRAAARAYAAARPAAVLWGNAIEQNVHAFDTARSLVCLMALCGNLDAPGGNIQANEPPSLGLGKFVRADLVPDKPKQMIHAHFGTAPRLMTVPPAYFRRAVLEQTPYPVKGAYVQCANPVMSWADTRRTVEALCRLDFLAVSDIFPTPTTAFADVVLPAATHFEIDDIGHYGLGHGILLARPKIVDPPGECRSDMDILNDLGRRMTDPAHWFDDPHRLLDLVLSPTGLDFRGFAEKGYLIGPESFYKYRRAGFKTPSGKVELAWGKAAAFDLPALPEYSPVFRPDPKYPLTLTSAKNPYFLHSSYRWVAPLREKRPHPTAELHPETARALEIQNGDPIHIETPYGHFIQFARLKDSVKKGVVCAGYGWWLPESAPDDPKGWEKHNYNMATSAHSIGKAFGTPNLKGIPCRIEKGKNSVDAGASS